MIRAGQFLHLFDGITAKAKPAALPRVEYRLFSVCNQLTFPDKYFNVIGLHFHILSTNHLQTLKRQTTLD